MRKCKVIGEVEVMEMAGVRTRAMTTALAAAAAKVTKRRKTTVSSTAEYQIAYLQLRSRSLVMTAPRILRSKARNYTSPRCSTPDRDEISRCESNESCDHEVGENFESAVCCSSFARERRETPPHSSSRRDQEFEDLESTAERRSPPGSTAAIKPSDAEIEEFFAAAEQKAAQHFATSYNYDIVNDVPLKGRYDWARISQ